VTPTLSPHRRKEAVNALRRGTVPHNGLDVLAVGFDRFEATIEAELDTAAAGGAVFKAVRDEYGSGKTFFARWMGEKAKGRGMAVAEVQISETETPLHRLETVSRTTPAFVAVLHGNRTAPQIGDLATAEGLVAWLGGQPRVAAALRRAAGVRGDLDRVDQFADFDPRAHDALTLTGMELTEIERNAATSAAEVELDPP
jgi:hypothetical protein